MLIDVVGKGGNLLMNVGPDELGRFPGGSTRVLRTIGKWLEKNGESIYGAGACADFPYQIRWGGITARPKTMYLHLLNAYEIPDELKLCNLETKVRRVYLLETGEELKFFQSYEIARDEYRFRVVMPKVPTDTLDLVVVAELEEEPKIHSIYMNFDHVKD